jgi:hypothetical protein
MRRAVLDGWPIAGLLLSALVGCGSPQSISSGEPAAVGGRVEANGFVLDVHLPASTFASGDAIPITTTFTWVGPAPAATIWGSGMGPVTFGFSEVGGQRRAMGGVMTADCSPKEFQRGVPVAIPLMKSGAYDGNDPQADFYRAFFADPLLHLPPGQWQLRVSAGGYLKPCDMAAPTVELNVPVIALEVR